MKQTPEVRMNFWGLFHFFAFKMVGKNLKFRNFADSLLNNKE